MDGNWAALVFSLLLLALLGSVALWRRRRSPVSAPRPPAGEAPILGAVLNDLPDLVCRWRPDGTLLYVNDAFGAFFGQPRNALVGRSFFELVPGGRRGRMQSRLEMLSASQSMLAIEERLFDAQGKEHLLAWKHRGLFDATGGLSEIQSTGRDVTGTLEQAHELEVTSRILRTLSRCNSSLVHATEEGMLLNEVCRHIVETGGYRMAWVGYAERTQEKVIRPVALHGEGVSLLDELDLSWGAAHERNCPTCQAILTGEANLERNLGQRMGEAPWIAAAVKRGFRSLLAVPLIDGDEVFGALSILSDDPQAFEPVEIKLLLELAQDISYGVRSLRSTAERLRLDDLRIEQARQIQETLVEMVKAMTLAVEQRDPYTAGHETRVSQLAVAIAEKMGLSPQQVLGVRLGALVHDIGKIAIPSEILNRPGLLSPTEMALIRPHPQIGHDILSGIHFPWPVAEMVLEHHERMDGSGYPKGLKDGAIRIESRILAVADAVDAGVTHRPYRPAKPIETVLGEVEMQRGKGFDEQVVDTCLTLFRDQGFEWQEALGPERT